MFVAHAKGYFGSLCHLLLLDGWQVDPLAPHPSGRDLLEMYRALQTVEKDVLQVHHCLSTTFEVMHGV
jgi:hypothetical protein